MNENLTNVLNIIETPQFIFTFRKKDFMCSKCKQHKININNIIFPDCKYKCLEELFILNIDDDIRYIIKEQQNNNFILIESIEIKKNSNKIFTIHTPYGLLSLRKINNIGIGNDDFGKTVCIILPAHGDFNCQCKQCSIYRLSREYENKGYEIESFIDKID